MTDSRKIRAARRAELADFGLDLIAAGDDDEMTQHGTAALWVSAHGRSFTHRGQPLPAGIQPGEPFKCFANAQHAAATHGLGYAEGFAGPRQIQGSTWRWTMHAWNIDTRGHVVDPTWDTEPGRAGRYFGIIFTDLPEGERAGISLLADMLGGKFIYWDRATGRARFMDAVNGRRRMAGGQQ